MPGPSGQVVVALGPGRRRRGHAAGVPQGGGRPGPGRPPPAAGGDDPAGRPPHRRRRLRRRRAAGPRRADVARALAEGTILGAYRYNALKSDPEASNVVRVDVVDGGEGDGDGLVDRRVRAGRHGRGGRVPGPRPGQRARRRADPHRLRRPGGRAGPGRRLHRRGARPGRHRGREDGRPAGRQPRLRRGAPVRQAGLRARRGPGDRGPGGQGHHVRLRRPVAQDHRGHGRHEVRHGGRRRRARHLQRPRRGSNRRCGCSGSCR